VALFNYIAPLLDHKGSGNRLFSETCIDVSDAAVELGRPPDTLARWATKGIVIANGDRVRLEVVRTKRGLETSREALERFAAATGKSLKGKTTEAT
jgi:hypothetical protein